MMMASIPRLVFAATSVLALTLCPSMAAADPGLTAGYAIVPGHIAGSSWNGLGTFSVDYQRLAGGTPALADAINDVIDAEAGGIVAAAHKSGTDQKPWTFTASGALSFYSISIATLFIGRYDADLPNLPFDSVATRVFDARNGAQITWDNLFVDKTAGLARLSEQTKAILPTVPRPAGSGELELGYLASANELNFKAWLPTAAGLELHFGDFQFGRGLPVITVPWAQVADLIAPQFGVLTGTPGP